MEIVHQVVEQLVPLFALSQRVAHGTHPGLVATHQTTGCVENAVLFELFESLPFTIATVNVTFVPLAAVVGVTGIRRVSFPIGVEIFVVFVHVTPVPTCAPHDHQLSLKEVLGPIIFVGTVRISV